MKPPSTESCQAFLTDWSGDDLTNSIIAEPFSLQRSVRKGRPLSPLLFALAAEAIAAAARTHRLTCH